VLREGSQLLTLVASCTEGERDERVEEETT
jgi:hypothetical protein